jgi:hypothetical protein
MVFLLFITQIIEFIVSKMMHFTSISFFEQKINYLFLNDHVFLTHVVFLCVLNPNTKT